MTATTKKTEPEAFNGAMVIGVDPAPKNGLDWFDGTGWGHVPPANARSKVKDWIDRGFLIAWDAPLYCGFAPDHFYRRPIEVFFQNGAPKRAIGLGCNVGSYSGLQHWTISQVALGWPRPAGMTPTRSSPSIQLHRKIDNAQVTSPGVVEVHPAIAIFVILGGRPVPIYKGKKKERHQLWSRLEKSGCPVQLNKKRKKERIAVDDHDALDASVAWWCAHSAWHGQALVLGDTSTGGFVVPATESAEMWQDRFREFASAQEADV